jgi:Ca2+:H+ antiporter
MKPDEEEREIPQISITVALVGLAIVTVFVALCAEFLVGAIDSVVEESGISKNFVGLILLPIVGNAAEHATAVTVACKVPLPLLTLTLR